MPSEETQDRPLSDLPRVEFALQAEPTSPEQWRTLAEEAERSGFTALVVPDHPGTTASPFVALAAAASVTSRIALGPGVLNSGVRHPIDVASDVATLDVISAGRSLLGLGAGHTPLEWASRGEAYPVPAERVQRLMEMVATVPRLLAGETVSFRGGYFDLHEASLQLHPSRAVPLLVGGSNHRILQVGAEQADTVELGGTGRTLPDGHYHETRWSEQATDQLVDVVWRAAEGAGRKPVISALVQSVAITDDAEGTVAATLKAAAKHVPAEALPSVNETLTAPYALVGTVEEIVDKLRRLRDRWGFTRYTVRDFEAARQVLSALGT